MITPARLTMLLGIALSLLGPSASDAQHAPLNGRYAFDAAASDDINRAIEVVVADLNFIIRPIARRRLRATNPTSDFTTIEAQASIASVTFDASPPLVAPTDGSRVEWTREDGERFGLSMTWEDTVLVQTLTAPEGVRINRFRVSEDSRTLTLQVSITSPRLDESLEYDLVYRRVNP